MNVRPRVIEAYKRPDGTIPYEQWFKTVKNLRMGKKVAIRLDRVEDGNLGDHRYVDKGVGELRIFGDACRVYYGEDEDKIILLLGGTKGTQDSDIAKAQEYWEDYNA